MTFYAYRQNNSGGYWEYDTFAGVAVNIFVEAPNVEEANRKFWRIVEGYGNFCECCGERWSDWSPDEGDVPTIYGRPFSEYCKDKDTEWYRSSDPKEPFAAIHYLDGTIELIQ